MRQYTLPLMALALWLPFPSSSCAGLFDFMHMGSGHPDVPAATAEARVKTYLDEVLGLKGYTVKNGHGALTAEEMKKLDNHITSRLSKAPAMCCANVAWDGASGIVAVAAPGITDADWKPHKGFLGYLQVDTALVFPGEADRAVALAQKVVGEHALYGFAPEAGPLWRVIERYLASGGMGGGMPDGAHLAADDGQGYQVIPGEQAPEEGDIPAWVSRGLTDLPVAGGKPVEMGLLIGLTRRPASTCVRLIHVAGVGPSSRGLFKDAQRLKKDGEE